MARAPSAARSLFAHREILSPHRDDRVEEILGHLSAYAQSKAEGVCGSALKLLKQPLIAAGFTDDKVSRYSERVQRTGGASRESLRRDIRNDLNNIAANQ